MLKTLNDSTSVNKTDFFSSLLVSPQAQRRLFAELYRRGRVSDAANRQSDLDLAGAVVSAIVESELTVFLKRENARGRHRNYRNGYLTRRLRMGEEVLTARIARDRDGVFEPSFVRSYARTFEASLEDILAFSVYEGYRREELAVLLFSLYEGQRAKGLALGHQMECLFESLDSWLKQPMDASMPILVGWEKEAHHCAGIEKRICGVKALRLDGTLKGLVAVACDIDSKEDLQARAVERLFDLGLTNVQLFFPLNCRPAFTRAVGRMWPQAVIAEGG